MVLLWLTTWLILCIYLGSIFIYLRSPQVTYVRHENVTYVKLGSWVMSTGLKSHICELIIVTYALLLSIYCFNLILMSFVLFVLFCTLLPITDDFRFGIHNLYFICRFTDTLMST